MAGWANEGRHPSIHRSIDRVRLGQPLHLASPSGITTHFYKLLCNKAHYKCWLHFTKPFHIANFTAMFAPLWVVFHKRMQWNGMDSRMTPFHVSTNVNIIDCLLFAIHLMAVLISHILDFITNIYNLFLCLTATSTHFIFNNMSTNSCYA